MKYYNPYADLPNGKWQKCNFHAHTEQLINWDTMSIVDKGFENLARSYKSAGFDAVCNSHKTTWIDYSELAKELGMSIFTGQEHVVEYDGIVMVGAQRFYDCPPQEAINNCIADGGFCFIAHPNQNLALKFPNIPGVYPHGVIDKLTGFTGIEIYNGCLPNRSYRDVPYGNALGTDIWDSQLSKGKKYWGFGSDDAHETWEINTGWVEVYAVSASFADIKASIEKGAFCVCRGLRLKQFEFSENRLVVEVAHTFMPIQDITYRFIAENGRVVKTCRAPIAEYTLNGEKYVRVEAAADDGSMLWTQPLLERNFFDIE